MSYQGSFQNGKELHNMLEKTDLTKGGGEKHDYDQANGKRGFRRSAWDDEGILRISGLLQ